MEFFVATRTDEEIFVAFDLFETSGEAGDVLEGFFFSPLVDVGLVIGAKGRIFALEAE